MDFDISYYTDQNDRIPVQDFLEEVFDKNYALWSECIASVEKIKHRRQIILLHGFIKKTEKTPLKELEMAQERLKTYQRSKYEN